MKTTFKNKIMKNITLYLVIIFSILGCTQSNNPNNNMNSRKEKIKEMETSELSDEQIKRKKESIRYCQSYKIPTIEHLPCIESEFNVKIRSKEDVIHRALALSYLGLKSEGVEKKLLVDYNKKYNISPYFTKVEKQYVNSLNPTEQQKTNANWRYESLHVLLWSLSYIDSLKYPNEMCNVGDDIMIIFEKSLKEFSDKAILRSKSEILNQADLIYRINWACVNARVKKKSPPSNLNSSIVYERHLTLNWLINYMNQIWDEVSTDT
jgi:hypothetical protein